MSDTKGPTVADGVNVAHADDTKQEKAPEKVATIRELFMFSDWIDFLYIFLGTLGAVVTGLCIPTFNILFGKVINTVNRDPSGFQDTVNFLCIILVVVSGINLFSGFFQVYFWTAAGERLTQKYREKYVNAVLSQEIGWFDTCGANELSTKVSEYIGKIQDGTGRKIGDLIQNTVQILACLGVAFYFQWKIACVLLCSIPAIGIAGAFMIKATTSASNQALEQYASAGGLASESLNAIRTVSALNMQPDIITTYRVFLFKAMNVGIVKGLKVGAGNGLVFGVSFLTYALGFWYGGVLVARDLESDCTDNCTTGGVVVTTFFATLMGSFALGQLTPSISALSEARAAAANVLEVINRKPLIDGLSNEGLVPDGNVTGRIELQDVLFAYPSRPNIQVCKNYSLTINAGESVALVGPSGVGKSTIINLLLRFYDPQSGVISLDGMDIKDLNIKWLRQHISLVSQEPVLFAGTIADNILYGLDPETPARGTSDRHSDKVVEGGAAGAAGAMATASRSSRWNNEELREKVVAAAKLANAHDFIMNLPQGYETDVGSNGVAMSGGQKQRIAIARALIRKPAVLLLDEATSALDAASERVVQQSIDALSQTKAQTTIIIAHRLSTIRNADKICVINDGKIAEMGTHDELYARNGLYADLIRLQMNTEDDDASTELTPTSSQVALLDTVANEEAKVQGVADIVVDIETGAKAIADGGTVVAATTEDGVKVKDDEVLRSIKHEEEEAEAKAKKATTTRIWEMILSHPYGLTLSLIGAIFYGGIFPAWGMMLAYSEAILFNPDPHHLRVKCAEYAFYYILLAGVSVWSGTLQFYGVAQVGERIAATIRSDLFEALMRKNIGFFDREENNVGALTTNLSEDSRIINKAFGEAIAHQLQALATLLVALGLGLSASWKIGLIVIACFPLTILSGMVRMRAFAGQQYDNEFEDTPQNSAQQAKANTKAQAKKTAAAAGGGAAGPSASGKNDQKNAAAGQGVVSGSSSAVIATAFTHMRTVSAFSMQHHIRDHYCALTKRSMQKRVSRAIMGGFGFGGSNTAMYGTYALLFWYGSSLLKSGELNFLKLMIAMMTLMLGAIGIGNAMNDMGDQQIALEVATKIFATIDASKQSPIDGLDSRGLYPETNVQGRIELRNLTFRYPTRPDVEVCRGYSLTIESGETVALVGPSGSGKSTIINLLLRFYDPLQGEILLDGINIKDYNIRYLRSQLGLVSQEPVLFSNIAGTVEENIALARPQKAAAPLLTLQEAMRLSDVAVQEQRRSTGASGAAAAAASLSWRQRLEAALGRAVARPQPASSPAATTAAGHVAVPVKEAADDADIEMAHRLSDESGNTITAADDVIEACIAANAHDFISSFTDGYQTRVGEGSIMVSGGQKQRIAIARALIKKPAVLLLDEATSALDAASERVVQQSIDALSQAKAQTTIIIAHRLSTIRNADKICVVDAGEIVEVGTHDELLARNGLYAQLWAKQSGAAVSTTAQ